MKKSIFKLLMLLILATLLSLSVFALTACGNDNSNGGGNNDGGGNNNNNQIQQNAPTNVRVEQYGVLGWVFRFDTVAAAVSYDIEVYNTQTSQTAVVNHNNNIYQLSLLQAQPNTLYRLRVRASLNQAGTQNSNWSLAVHYGIPAPTIPTNLTAVFGNTLADVTLPSAAFSWAAPQTNVGNAGQAPTFYANYYRAGGFIPLYNIPLTVTVDRAEFPFTIPANLVAIRGWSVGVVNLPPRWEWHTPNATVTSLTDTAVFYATYTPTNLDNFVESTLRLPVQVTSFEDVEIGDANGTLLDRLGNLWTWGGEAFRGHGGGTGGSRVPQMITQVYSGQTNTLIAAPRFTKISAARYYTLALCSNGRAWSWGICEYGRTGHGTVSYVARPRAIGLVFHGTTNTTIVAPAFRYISAGLMTGMAIDTLGRIWSWGNGSLGRLGHGNLENQNRPRMIQLVYDGTTNNTLSTPNFTTVVAARFNGMAIDNQGRLWTWGSNNMSHAGHGTPASAGHPSILRPRRITLVYGTDRTYTVAAPAFTAVSAYWHGAALSSGGNIYTWGEHPDGTGHGGNTAATNIPTRPRRITLVYDGTPNPAIAAPTFTHITVAQSNSLHTMAIDTLGRTWSWGNNHELRLGLGISSTSAVRRPRLMTTAFGDGGIIEVPAFTAFGLGIHHMGAIDSDGNFWTWGNMQWGWNLIDVFVWVSRPQMYTR